MIKWSSYLVVRYLLVILSYIASEQLLLYLLVFYFNLSHEPIPSYSLCCFDNAVGF